MISFQGPRPGPQVRSIHPQLDEADLQPRIRGDTRVPKRLQQDGKEIPTNEIRGLDEFILPYARRRTHGF